MNLQNINVGQLVAQIKSILLAFFSFGIVVLAAGWISPKLGLPMLKLPSAAPQELVYAAGIVWLLK